MHLYAVAADGSAEPELLVGGEQAISRLRPARRQARLHRVDAHDDARALRGHRGHAALTNVGGAFTDGRELVEPERFTAVSQDGYEVDAWIVRPAGLRAGQALPGAPDDPRRPVHAVRHRLLRRVPGLWRPAATSSSSRTRAAAPATRRSTGARSAARVGDAGPGWGTRDYEDVMAVVDTALETFDFIDPERLGVIGGSYGGYMTSWIIGHTNRFKAAISERAVNNLVSMFGSSDLFWVFERQFGGPLWENVDAYLEKSPSTYAKDDRDAGARAALRAGPALQHRAGRASVHAAAPARQGRRAAPLPRREPRADARRLAAATASPASRRCSSGSTATSSRASH